MTDTVRARINRAKEFNSNPLVDEELDAALDLLDNAKRAGGIRGASTYHSYALVPDPAPRGEVEWCPCCHEYHAHPIGEKQDNGLLVRECPLNPYPQKPQVRRA